MLPAKPLSVYFVLCMQLSQDFFGKAAGFSVILNQLTPPCF
jgi:hypothetical protein